VTKKIFGLVAKFPEPGRVKTRLARDIGFEDAAKVYKTIAEGVFRKTRSETTDYERVIFYSPAEMRLSFEEWLPGETLMPQRGGDVGEVMQNALEEMFASGAEKTVLSGVDIPDLNRDIIIDAFSRLDNADIVIGPAEDGGYYLIGMKSLHREVFRKIPWGTDAVFAETISVIKEIGLKYEAVDKLFDVDRLEDLQKAGYGEDTRQ
jgi:rSAM/selenodomain-associated transferase 1